MGRKVTINNKNFLNLTTRIYFLFVFVYFLVENYYKNFYKVLKTKKYF
ncbi:hypothetical protein CLK_3590 [Clostridium botulinum A3 str. Loch Maree]|nr:hypothetical protein CLK_3590 [Clostridium botulinum A3 str. Loch Maree]